MLYYIKQHIKFCKLVIAGDYEAMSDGQRSQPEKLMFSDNYSPFILPTELKGPEVKKTHFFPEYLDFSQLLI